MKQKYLVKHVGEYTFKFKLDLNPLTKDYEPHIWHRHLITPDDAIKAFFTISDEEWNERYQRYEAYSSTYDIMLYYMKLKEGKQIFAACLSRSRGPTPRLAV